MELHNRTLGQWLEHWAETTPDKEYIVYSGEFIEDYDALDDKYRGDFSTITELGNEGVFILLQESKGAERTGHTSPNHRITPRLSQV